MRDDFVAFILTHGRPCNVKTYHTLREQGYTGKIYFILDNEDETIEKYEKEFGRENIIVFDKEKASANIDTADLAQDRRAVVYARNQCFQIASMLGFRYFLQLDDDYTKFRFRYEEGGKLRHRIANDLDAVFDCMIDFLNESGALTVAFAQGGDFIGGINNVFWKNRLKRKAMNTFFCDVQKPFSFVGSINEDVNMYTTLGNRGKLILSIADVSVEQLATQSNPGGLTDIYLALGTYVKSFYSVIFSPQCVKVAEMGVNHRRMHHFISWNHCTPMILPKKYKKK